MDKDGTVHTIEAYGTDEATFPFERDVSDFTDHKGWKEFYRPKMKKIVLIECRQLEHLMIDFDLGVTNRRGKLKE